MIVQLLLQTAVVLAALDAPADTVPVRRIEPPRWDLTHFYSATLSDTVKRKKPPLIEYSDVYHTRNGLHKAMSFAMIPLFVGSAYTGFQLRNKGDQAPKWTRDIHGPLAGGTVILYGMNTLTGVWNLWEGRKDPVDRKRKLIHSALFLAAGAGFAYVTAAGDNIRASGKSNHWHRDIALGSMGISVISWSLMLFR